MIKIDIDGRTLEVEPATTILQAAEAAGISIPHLCYHKAFPPEGSCRMCLVQIEGYPKLELACSTQVKEGMKILTDSQEVKNARRSALEFLLAEHPPDCPICDKAGECKLQDYYEDYGLFESRYAESKSRRPKRLEIGNNLLLDQERCILCTRCVRFLRHVTKTGELGVMERGIRAEINVYPGNPVSNNYSGNLAEICPVGAITDQDFRFKTRAWFLEEKPSICPLCSRGCAITINYHPGYARFQLPQRVYRIRARENPAINGNWICNIGRYGYSYMDANRAVEIRIRETGVKSDWNGAMDHITGKIMRLVHMKRTSRIAVVLNTFLSNEELYLIKRIFLDDLGVDKIYFMDPPEAASDDFLLTPERTPNRRGAEELGFSISPPPAGRLAEQTELLFVFGNGINDQVEHAIGEEAEPIGMKILLSSHQGPSADRFDCYLPTAVISEKSGSLTNVDGCVQSFAPALEPPVDSRPLWRILTELGRKMAVDFQTYRGFASARDIYRKLGQDIPFFRK